MSEAGLIGSRRYMIPELGRVYILTDKNGRQVIGWSHADVLPGVVELKDPMLCGEKVEQGRDGHVSVSIVVLPIFRSVLVPEFKTDVVSVISVDRSSKMVEAYFDALYESQTALRAAQSGLQMASSIPSGLISGGR